VIIRSGSGTKFTGYRREDLACEAGESEKRCREGARENRTEDGERHVSAQKPMDFLADIAKFKMQSAKLKFNRWCFRSNHD
jgi:hypothetical protein